MSESKKQIEELINSAQPESRKVMGEIFAIEKEKLYMSNPYGIVEDIVEKVKEIVK